MKKLKLKILKWLIRCYKKDLVALYDSLKSDDATNVYAMWGDYSHLMRKVFKIHICTCIETLSRNEREAALIRETINDLETFLLLYYNTVDNEVRSKKK